MKVKTLILYFFLLSNFVNGQKVSFLKFDSCFPSTTSPLLIDDVAVKYSTNNPIPYHLIKQYVKYPKGTIAIEIDNKKYHNFWAMGKWRVNDSINSYLFSHQAANPNKAGCYTAYLAVFKIHKLTDFRTIYINCSSPLYEENFGAAFDKNKYFVFTENRRTYFSIDDQGFIFENKQNFDLEIFSIKRVSPYKLKLNSNFYKGDKVLLPIKAFGKMGPKQILRQIGKNKVRLQTTYYIDILEEEKIKKIIYLNQLQSEEISEIFEVIVDVYNQENNWLRSKMISIYIMSNNIEILESHTLNPTGFGN